MLPQYTLVSIKIHVERRTVSLSLDLLSLFIVRPISQLLEMKENFMGP